ncbi:protein Aster-B-like [Centruroides vittatus]|uniref:protein Aster-B-like n=1 Tax=Centruroides vittatus TaxID=120091 RepID=UPI00350F7E77
MSAMSNECKQDFETQREMRQNNSQSQNSAEEIETTESDTEDEVHCPVENHEGREMIDILLPFSVEYVKQLLFTDSQWFRDFLDARKTTDVVTGEWHTCPETGDKLRQLTYTMALNLAIAKSTRSSESQRILKNSEQGRFYVIETDVSNNGVPYSDSFSIKSHNCLTRISKNQCRFRVYSQISYKKSVWGLVKTVIEKNAMQGAIDFCTDIEKALKAEASKVTKERDYEKIPKPVNNLRQNISKRAEILQQTTPSCESESETSANIPRTLIADNEEVKFLNFSTEFIIKAILTILAVLLLLNMVLILKLGSLEDLSIKLNSFPDDLVESPVERIPNLSRGEFMRILRKQEVLHRTEVLKWQDALNDVLKLFHMMEGSLLNLKTTIESYSNSEAIKTMVDEK